VSARKAERHLARLLTSAQLTDQRCTRPQDWQAAEAETRTSAAMRGSNAWAGCGRSLRIWANSVRSGQLPLASTGAVGKVMASAALRPVDLARTYRTLSLAVRGRAAGEDHSWGKGGQQGRTAR
jgi:hypothetical protein